MLQRIEKQTIIHAEHQNKIAIDGQLDGRASQRLWENAKQLHENGARNIVIDMRGVRNVSTHGVQILTRIDALFSPHPKKNIVRYKRHAPNNKGRLKRVKRRAIVSLKLLNLDPRAEAALCEGGFTEFIAIYGDS